jgi:MATE family multidrug resistance protein
MSPAPPKPATRAVLWSIATLAAPMLLGQAGQVLLQITDTVMVGRLGAVALAATSLAGNFVMFALYFAYGSLGAVAPRVGGAFGAGDAEALNRIARAGAVLGLAVGLLVALALTAVVPFLGRIGQPPEVVDAVGGYFLLIAWSMPGAMLSVVLGQMAEAVNRPWPVLAIMAGAVVLNGVLNVVLIFGHLGLPALGIEGAGWATLMARSAQAVALLVWIAKDRQMRQILRAGTAGGIGEKFVRLFREGLPVAGQDVLEGGSFALGSIMLGWLGTTALAANQVTISIASLAWMFPMALATAASVRVAQTAGGGNLGEARRCGLAAVGMGVGLMAVCAVIYISFGPFLARLFTPDPAVAKLAGTLVVIAGIYQISDAIQSVSLGALRGLLDNKVPLIANAVCYWVLSLPTVYLLTFPLSWGAVGVWVGYLPWMVLTGLFFLARFLQRTRLPGLAK